MTAADAMHRAAAFLRQEPCADFSVDPRGNLHFCETCGASEAAHVIATLVAVVEELRRLVQQRDELITEVRADIGDVMVLLKEAIGTDDEDDDDGDDRPVLRRTLTHEEYQQAIVDMGHEDWLRDEMDES